jgi:hypothetical protein
MSVETSETIREKLAQTRRLLQQTTDPSTMESLRIFVEDLERRLLLKMGSGSPSSIRLFVGRPGRSGQLWLSELVRS